MQAEMNKLFAEGGVMQEGGTVDPVSGNEVPVGAMAEEVRDDIPAQLSEGEFVFPADVVRFIGLQTLMKLRDKAKTGLQRMNEIGQMGNAEEVPDGEALFGGEEMDDDMFSSEIDSIMSEDDSEEDRGYAEGGYVVPENAKLYRDAPMKGFEMVPMTNDEGQTMYIPYINGVAQLGVPAGYRVRKSDEVVKPDVDTKTDTTTTTSTDNGGGGGDGIGSNTSPTTDASGLVSTPNISSAAITGIAAVVSAVTGLPVSTIASVIGPQSIANAMNSMTNSANAAANNAAMASVMGLTPAEAATPTGQAATASAVDSASAAIGGQATASAGPTGTGGVAASAASAAASATTSMGFSNEAIGLASQTAATAAINGMSQSEATAAGIAAAVSSTTASVAGSADAEADAAAGDTGGSDAGTSGTGGDGTGSGADAGSTGDCVDPAVLIMLGDKTYVPAGTIKVGDVLFAMHETTQEFGLYPVEHSEEVQQPKAIVKFSDGSTMTTSHSHKFFMVDGSWKQVYELEQADVVKAAPGETDKVVFDIEAIDDGPVMKITVKDAHTYISEGLISHNMKANGGIIKRKHMVAPTSKGPDDGYVALQVGEFVIKEKTTKGLGERKLKALNEGRADIVMRKESKGLAGRRK